MLLDIYRWAIRRTRTMRERRRGMEVGKGVQGIRVGMARPRGMHTEDMGTEGAKHLWRHEHMKGRPGKAILAAQECLEAQPVPETQAVLEGQVD